MDTERKGGLDSIDPLPPSLFTFLEIPLPSLRPSTSLPPPPPKKMKRWPFSRTVRYKSHPRSPSLQQGPSAHFFPPSFLPYFLPHPLGKVEGCLSHPRRKGEQEAFFPTATGGGGGRGGEPFKSEEGRGKQQHQLLAWQKEREDDERNLGKIRKSITNGQLASSLPVAQ